MHLKIILMIIVACLVPHFHYTKCGRRYGKYFLLGHFFVACTIDFFHSGFWFYYRMVSAQLFGVS